MESTASDPHLSFHQLSDTALAAQVRQWLTADAWRMHALAVHASLNLPDSWLGAGFTRNLIWDRVHGYTMATPLNDVDVIYFDASDTTKHAEQVIAGALNARAPDINWQVRNQARMHLRHGHAPYVSSLQAMGHWVEKETAIAVRLLGDHTDVVTAHGLHCCFANTITRAPGVDTELFHQRISQKNWLTSWPQLRVIA